MKTPKVRSFIQNNFRMKIQRLWELTETNMMGKCRLMLQANGCITSSWWHLAVSSLTGISAIIYTSQFKIREALIQRTSNSYLQTPHTAGSFGQIIWSSQLWSGNTHAIVGVTSNLPSCCEVMQLHLAVLALFWSVMAPEGNIWLFSSLYIHQLIANFVFNMVLRH